MCESKLLLSYMQRAMEQGQEVLASVFPETKLFYKLLSNRATIV